MATKKAQSKAGVPAQRRGQQMGDERSNDPSKMLVDKANTPAARGDRPEANEFFADNSAQQAGGDAARPRTVAPSTPAALPTGEKLGESGGERAARQRETKGRK